MAIRKSAGADVEGLIAELRAHPGDAARHEAALARLAVIGRRAIVTLLAALKSARSGDERRALFTALERIPDGRSIEVVLAVLGLGDGAREDETGVRVAAVRAARPLLALTPHGTSLLERLTVLALDAAEPLPLRRAALEALGDLPARSLEPLRQRLLGDPDPAVRALAEGDTSAPADLDVHPAALPGDARAALDAVGRMGGETPLPLLHALLAPVRARESEGGRRRADWTSVRGAIHLSLARRQSRVALYDLREAFESESIHPLPADFTVAVGLIGDATCLEPLARAWLHAQAAGGRHDEAWTGDVRDAFRAVLAKEKPASRRKLAQRLEQRWGAGLKELVGGTVTRRRGKLEVERR